MGGGSCRGSPSIPSSSKGRRHSRHHARPATCMRTHGLVREPTEVQNIHAKTQGRVNNGGGVGIGGGVGGEGEVVGECSS